MGGGEIQFVFTQNLIPDDRTLNIVPNVAGRPIDELERENHMCTTQDAAHFPTNGQLSEENAKTDDKVQIMDTLEWLGAVASILPQVVGPMKRNEARVIFASLVLPILDLDTARIVSKAEAEVDSAGTHLQRMLEISDPQRATVLAGCRDATLAALSSWASSVDNAMQQLSDGIIEANAQCSKVRCSHQHVRSQLEQEAAALQGLTRGLALGADKQLWERRISEIVASELQIALSAVEEQTDAAMQTAKKSLTSKFQCEAEPPVCSGEPLVQRLLAAGRRMTLMRATHKLRNAIIAASNAFL